MSKTAVLVGIVLAGARLFAALNMVCWRPGIGSGRESPLVSFDRYFGWPAYYQAEAWVADDPKLFGRILKAAPFYDPRPDMTRRRMIFNLPAALVDGGFAAAAIGVVLLLYRAKHPIGWQRFGWPAIIILVIALGVLYLVGDRVSAICNRQGSS